MPEMPRPGPCKMVIKDTLWHVASWYGRARGVSTRSAAPRTDRKVRRYILIYWAGMPGSVVGVLARTLARYDPSGLQSSGASVKAGEPAVRTECTLEIRYHDHPQHESSDPGPPRMMAVAAGPLRFWNPGASMALAVRKRRPVSADAQLTEVRSTGNWPAPLLTRAVFQTPHGAGIRRSPIH
jgi:hypothetical protein